MWNVPLWHGLTAVTALRLHAFNIFLHFWLNRAEEKEGTLVRRAGLTHNGASRVRTGARLRLNMQNSAISLLRTDMPHFFSLPFFPSAETLREDLSSYEVDRFLCA